ncbi:MAG: GntR family transcriptional regulator [Lachnospiraceae bacterium]|nr:GntR family transcriptional regulator [Lachnospiraceae bacterium]
MDDRLQANMDEYLPLRDVVFKTLRQEILLGDLKPGERLMEIHLANKLGVSRTPIREAIRKLELEGLVTMIPRRGAEVAQITVKNLQDVLEVRKALDVLSAELACDRITEEQMTELREACQHFEHMIQTKDSTKIAKADVDLHDIITKSTGNDKLILMVNNLSEQMYRYRYEHIKDPSSHERLIAEHQKILSALENRDKEAAANAVGEHIDNQEKAIMQQLRE